MRSEYSKWLKLRDKLSVVSSEFLEVIHNIDPNLSEQEGVCGYWSPKEIVAHIIGWEKEVIEQFRSFLKGSTVTIKYNINSFNQKSVDSRKHLSWEEVIKELEFAQKELKQINNSLVEKNIVDEKRFISWVNTLIKHYKHHKSQIKELTR